MGGRSKHRPVETKTRQGGGDSRSSVGVVLGGGGGYRRGGATGSYGGVSTGTGAVMTPPAVAV